MRRTTFIMTLLATALALGCGKSETPPPAQAQPGASAQVSAAPVSAPEVVVINYPLQYMAERIAGDTVSLTLPVPPNREPAYWKPKEEDIALMQAADLVLLNGAEHEKWLDTVTLDEARLADTSAHFSDRYIVAENAIVHSHGPEGTHSHDGTAYSVWIDPTLAALQADAVAEALTGLLPEREAEFAQGLAALKEDIAEWEAVADAFAAGYRQQPVLTSHPVYQYLERRLSLNLEDMHWEPYEMPSEGEWEVLDALLEEHPAKWMIWEGEPTADTRAALEERGIGIIVFEMCGNVPDEGDYLSVMRGNYGALLQINAGYANGHG